MPARLRLRRHSLAASLLLLATLPARAQAPADIEAMATAVRPIFGLLLQRAGITELPAGNPEREAVLRASLAAMLRATPAGCAAMDWILRPEACGRHPLSVASAAMAPTMLPGEAFFTERVTPDRPLARGDIVVFRPAGEDNSLWTYRLIGLPGERVQIRAGRVEIDGVPIAQETTPDLLPAAPEGLSPPLRRVIETLPDGRRYAIARPVEGARGVPAQLEDTPVLLVPDGHYFLLGDNRVNAADSRLMPPYGPGFVAAASVAGRVGIRYLARDPARIGKPPR